MTAQNKQRTTHKFPTKMFATAGIVSFLMVSLISAIFAQANAPCVHHYPSQGSVVVNTHNTQVEQSNIEDSLTVCNRNNQQVTWLTWLFKQSDSIEFHYLDLLELLSRK